MVLVCFIIRLFSLSTCIAWMFALGRVFLFLHYSLDAAFFTASDAASASVGTFDAASLPPLDAGSLVTFDEASFRTLDATFPLEALAQPL